MLESTIDKKIYLRLTKNLIRKRTVIHNKYSDKEIVYFNGRKYIDFSSNDYLCLHHHPKIIKSLTKSIREHGFGSGASPLVSGFHDNHLELEVRIAKWLNVDSALLFSSGYLANIGVLQALLNRSDTVFSDRLCHSSILDGIHLSRANNIRYKHCSIKHLKKLFSIYKPDFIVTESVFSMEGSIAPINKIAKLCQKHHANLIIDDAHGIGILGSDGKGISNHYNITQNQFACLLMPLGKSFNGMGAIVAGSKKIIEYILQFANTYRYNTALPPAITAGLNASLSLIIKEPWRNSDLKKNICFFISYAKTKNIPLTSYDITPIKCIIVGCSKKAIILQNILLLKGIYAAAIRSPTVPEESARIRISINCMHTKNQIMLLLNYISVNI